MTTILTRRKIPYHPVFGSFRTANHGDDRKYFAPLNIIENDTVYKVELNLAGWRKEDIEIKIEEDTLIIQGEKAVDGDKNNQYRVQEFNQSRFLRSVILGEVIDQESIEARLEDGILRIEMKKIEEDDLQLSKKIEIL